jgi:protein-S-isoprenylcysteine O-methyltransferase Ste14
LDRGPFRVSRNPLYLGLLTLHAGIALLWPSFWALVAVRCAGPALVVTRDPGNLKARS